MTFGPYVLKQIWRHRVRSLLTVLGIGIAMFLFTSVQAMNRGVTSVTRANANDTALIVYREDRYCPATSELPQDYLSRIERVPGVTAAIPVKVVVSNCRTSLDVVTYRGVPKGDFLFEHGDEIELLSGSYEDWHRRTDAALVGEILANRRGLRPGMTFDAAGITVLVAGVFRSSNPQFSNAAITSLEFVQLAGRDQLGVVTQFNVKVEDASMLERVASEIDDVFEVAQQPTATFSEQAFVARVADDVIELVGFARWLGIGCLVAVLALIGNAIVLSVQSRIAEHAVLQTLGYSSRLVAALIVIEGLALALLGGAMGAAAAVGVAHVGGFALSVEGVTVPIVADADLLVTGVVVCGVLGVLAGLVPAWQASRREIAACFRMV
ncbi:MAG: ABC transporter permease [Planctomycetota bacterium]